MGRTYVASLRRVRSALLASLAVALAISAAGCDKKREDARRIDAEWHRVALSDGLLARWLAAAPTESGFMRTAFDRRWNASADQPGYLTDHARLVYSLAIGYEVTRDQRYLDAASHGADYLLSRFRDPIHGGFFKRVAADGKVVSEAKNTYGHAFALFALSHMARVTGAERYGSAALVAWNEISTRLRHPRGGFVGELPRDFGQERTADSLSSQNPIMHLFEALLALHDATRNPVALSGAKEVADFVVYRLLVGMPDGAAYIPEWFDADWNPLGTREKGAYIDIGHQFEWSHMLMEAEKRGLVGVYGQVADRLLKFSIKTGYDETDGGVFAKVFPDGSVGRDKYWWQQCEAIRAFLAAATRGDQPDMWGRYEKTLKLVRDEFIDKADGGWYSKARKECGKGGCPDAQVEPYHMAAMHRAALEIAGAPR